MTRAERAQLRFFLGFRDRPLTVGGLFWANRRRYLFLLATTGAGAALLYLGGGPTAAAFAGVAVVAAVARDIGHFRRSAAAWPVTREVIDWEKVEQLASDAGGNGA